MTRFLQTEQAVPEPASEADTPPGVDGLDAVPEPAAVVQVVEQEIEPEPEPVVKALQPEPEPDVVDPPQGDDCGGAVIPQGQPVEPVPEIGGDLRSFPNAISVEFEGVRTSGSAEDLAKILKALAA